MSTPSPVPAHELRADNVSFSIGTTDILRNVSLTLKPGSLTALLGPSGSGKSTMLRLLCGLERPDSGEIWHGEDCLSSDEIMRRAEDRRIGLIFQDFALFPHLTLAQNVMFGLDRLSKADAKDKALGWLDRVGLSDRAEDYPHTLSGGEQQRVAIARALAPEPIAILMDEPFSGLDPALRASVRAWTGEIVKAANIPALLVTHDPTEAMMLADQLCVMRAGKIVQSGLPDEVYKRPVDLDCASALGSVISVDAVWNAAISQFDTAFGPVALDKDASPSASAAEIHMRPEAILLDPTSGIIAEIRSFKRVGHLLFATIVRQSQQIEVTLPVQTEIAIGQSLSVRIDPSLCWAF